jgi:hypothetical protein
VTPGSAPVKARPGCGNAGSAAAAALGLAWESRGSDGQFSGIREAASPRGDSR